MIIEIMYNWSMINVTHWTLPNAGEQEKMENNNLLTITFTITTSQRLTKNCIFCTKNNHAK